MYLRQPFTDPSSFNVARKDLRVQEAINLHMRHSLRSRPHIGSKIRQIHQDRSWLQQDGIDFKCSILLGGQIKDPELYLIYNQGNFIQATSETPFTNWETKYGRPILDHTQI